MIQPAASISSFGAANMPFGNVNARTVLSTCYRSYGATFMQIEMQWIAGIWEYKYGAFEATVKIYHFNLLDAETLSIVQANLNIDPWKT